MLLWLFLSVLPSASVHTLNFNLTASDAILLIGSSFKLNCNIDDANYDYMFFYKFLPGHGLKLMVYSYQAGYLDPEPDFETGIEFERPTVLELRLKIQSVKVQDTAMYFCSARYAHTEAGVSHRHTTTSTRNP